jgi:cbb3-type cytochrome oxidase subunit 3
MKRWKAIGMLVFVLAGLFLLFTPTLASAQGCALCYTQAAASGSRMIQALKSGILILIAPPTFMTIGMIFICYHKRNQTRADNADQSDREWDRSDSLL